MCKRSIRSWRGHSHRQRIWPIYTTLCPRDRLVCNRVRHQVASSIISVSVVARAVARGGGIHNIGTELLLGGLLLLTVTISHFTDVIFVWMKKIHNSCRDVKTRSKISVSICDSHRTATSPGSLSLKKCWGWQKVQKMWFKMLECVLLSPSSPSPSSCRAAFINQLR